MKAPHSIYTCLAILPIIPLTALFLVAICCSEKSRPHVAYALAGAWVQPPADPRASVKFWTPRAPPQAKYQIDCAVQIAEEALIRGKVTVHFKGKVTVHLVNTTTGPLQRLAIDWERAADQSLRIKAGGQAVDLPAEVTSFPQEFLLAEPLEPGQPLTLEIEFAMSVPVPPEGLNKLGPADQWPRLWWGIRTHDDYELKMQAPEGYAVVTSGEFNPATDTYRAISAPSMGWILLKGYDVLEGLAGEVTVRCFQEPEHAECARLIHETAVDAVNFYRDWLGFYPHRVLSILPGIDQPAGGYAPAAGMAVIHGMGRMDEKPELHWRWITAHEIGHQYWGMHVMEKDDPGWLWIGLGIYADREYCRARGLGNTQHEELMKRYVQGVRRGLDTTINLSEEQGRRVEFDFDNVVIHGKGFSIISALDCLLGSATFERIYRRCLREFRGSRMGLSEFRSVCEQESGHDLGWFFDQWVNSNRYLSYEISSQTCEKMDDTYVTNVEVRRVGNLSMPVPVTAHFTDGTSQQTFTDRICEREILRFESRSPLDNVQLDAKRALPLVWPPPSADDERISRNVKGLPWVGAGRKALEVYAKAREGQLADAAGWFKLGLVLYDAQQYQEAMESFRRTQALSKADRLQTFAAIVWQGHLFDLQGERQKALACYREALKHPSQQTLRHDQYGIQLNEQWARDRLVEPFRRR
jgi:hypothetical protein